MTPRTTPAAEPLGPESLTWKYFGDLRTGILGVWIGAIQNMYPELGAGVEDHSILLREPLQRVARSVYPIMGVVYDGDRAADTGAQIRGYHETIKGVDHDGRRYHALNPETFYWAHATFFKSTLLAAEKFGGGISEADKRQLFDEHVTWYRMYGMSMRPVPKSWEDFQVYWDHMCRNVLENNYAAREVMDLSTMPKHPSLQWIPDLLWAQNLKVMQRFLTFMTVALYDPPVRELMGYSWSARQQWVHDRLCQVITLVSKYGPKRRLMHPRKRSAMDRASGRLPMDSPLVETPARNLPPLEYRGQPQFYCPIVD